MTTQTGTNSNDTLTFAASDTAIDGQAGKDTLVFATTNADLTSTALISVEVLKAGLSVDTTFTVDPADLISGGSVLGSTGSDTLIIVGTSFNLTSTTLSSVETLKAGSTAATTFRLEQADLAAGGSIIGSTSAGDTIVINGTSLNLTSTDLTDIEILKAGKSTATTFSINADDLAALTVIDADDGADSGADTLIVKGAAIDLSALDASEIEILKAGATTAATFTVDAADLASGGSVVGNIGTDTLTVLDATIDLSSTTLSSIERLQAGTTDTTTFIVNQADLASGGSIVAVGTSTSDTVIVAGTSLDLTSTTLSDIERLEAGTTKATTFTINVLELPSTGGEIVGAGANDTLIIKSTSFDLTSTTLTSVEILKAGLAAATTFTVDDNDLAAGGSLIGSTGVDTLTILGTSFDVSSTTVSSVEKFVAGSTDVTTFVVNQADLASGGSIVGTGEDDILTTAGSLLDLSSTTLTSIEKLLAGTTAATTFIVNTNGTSDLASGGTVEGNNGNDTLVIKNTAFDLTSTTLTSIEILKAGLATATTFTVNDDDLATGGSVIGSTGLDTLTILSTDFDLSSTTLTSIEKLVAATTNATTFTLNQNDLMSGGSIVGHTTGTDVILAGGTSLNLSSTTLTSIEQLRAGTVSNTVLTVNQAQLDSLAIFGSSGTDTLQMARTLFDLTSKSLTSIEKLGAALSTATTFKVDAADLVSGGSVVGNTGIDTLTIAGSAFDLSHTGLASIERLVTGISNSTTFTVDQADLASGGSVIGSSSIDTLWIAGTSLNLASTTLTSIEILKAGTSDATNFTVDQADLAANGSVVGSSGNDTLTAFGTSLNLTSTTLDSVERLASVNSKGTTFTLDITDLGGLGSITGSTGTSDTLVVLSSVIDLSAKNVSDVETLKAGLNIATTFTVNQSDLDSGGSVIGSTGGDVLIAADTQLDLSSTTLTSIETLKAGNAGATTFTVNQADLVSGGAVNGSTGSDTIAAAGTNLDLTSTTLTSIERLSSTTTSTSGTKFTVDINDLTGLTSITGSTSAADTLVLTSTDFDLTGITITGVETLQAGVAAATTFTLDDPSSFAKVVGSAKVDTLISNSSAFDLSSTTLTSVEILKAGSTLATTFTVDQTDLLSGGTIISTNTATNDAVAAAGAALDLTSTTLSSIEIIRATQSTGTAFKVDQADLLSGGTVAGHSSGNDTLTINGASLDLTSTVLTSVETLKAGKATATTFIVDQLDLLPGGSVVGSTGIDTLQANGTELNLASTTITSVEILKAGNAAGTTFTVDLGDLLANGTISGHTSGIDTLVAAGAALDLTSTTLTSIEVLKTSLTTSTTLTVDVADLASGGSVVGNASTAALDTLIVKNTSFDLTSTVLTSIEKLQAGSTAATTFKLDAADLLSGGTVAGNGSAVLDTLVVQSATIDLTSTTLDGIEKLLAGTTNLTSFILDQADLASGGTVTGTSSTSDSLTINGTSLDLSSTTLASVEILKTNSTLGTTFKVDQNDLLAGGSVVGDTSTSTSDTLVAAGTTLNLTATSLTSIEILKAGIAAATVFTVDQADLTSGGSIIGSTGQDTLVAGGTELNLTGTTLTSIEKLVGAVAGTTGTTFTVDGVGATGADLAAGGSIAGTGTVAIDTLIIKGTNFDLSSTSLANIEILQAESNVATTFTLDQADLQSGGTVKGSSGNDILLANEGSLNLTSTTLSSIEILKAKLSTGTIFKVDQLDLLSGGSVQGHSGGTDSLVAAGAALDLTSTTLTSVEILTAASSSGTTFTIDQSDLNALTTIQGHTSGADKLVISGTSLDLTSATLSSIEILQAGSAGNTTFKVDQGDLAAGGTVAGHVSGTDTLAAAGLSLDLTSTSLSSVETLAASSSNGTTFTIDQSDLNSLVTIEGHTSGADSLIIHGTSLDLTSTTLTSIETLATDSSLGTKFTVNLDDLAAAGAVEGHSSGIDTLVINHTSFDLTSTTLTSIDVLKAGLSTATTFTVDQGDLASGGSIVGSSGSDTLIVDGNAIDLSSTTLTSIETIETAAPSNGTLFTIGAGQGGATVHLTVNGETDTIAFTSDYKVTTTTNDATILAHTLVIDNFNDGGTNGDVIDISSMANGAPTHSLDISSYIDLAHPATLKDALNLAAAGDGHTTSTIVTFQYAGDTYVLVDKSASATLGADDAVIKLVGAHTLSDGDNFSF